MSNSSLDTDAITTASNRLAAAYLTRLERELVAAWMAGYDALDVVRPAAGMAPVDSVEDILTLEVAFIGRHGETTPEYGRDMVATRYELDDMNQDLAEQVRRQGSADD